MEFLTTIGSSWKACFGLFNRSNRRLLLFATFGSIRDIYIIFLTQAWWLVPLCLVITWLFTWIGGLVFFIFIMAICTRSSVDIKNRDYFIKSIPLAGVYLMCLLVLALSLLLVKQGIFVTGYQDAIKITLMSHLEILLLLMLFFLLDSGLWLKSLINVPLNSIKLFLVNYPAFFLMALVLAVWQMIFFASTHVSAAFIAHYDSFLVTSFGGKNLHWWLIALPCLLFAIPFFFALIHTIYIRRVYDQSQLYTYL